MAATTKKAARGIKGGPFLVSHPFSGISAKDLRPVLQSFGEQCASEFPKLFSSLEAILLRHDPIQILSSLTFYGLTAFIQEGSLHPKRYKDGRFLQSHVELVQAMALRHHYDGTSEYPPPPIVQQLFDSLPKLGDLFNQRRLSSINQARTDKDHHVRILQEKLRLHTQQVRNWGYFPEVKEILRSLFAEIDQDYTSHIGLSATNIVRLFEYLCTEVEERTSLRFEALRQMKAVQSPSDAAKLYLSTISGSDDSPEDLSGFFSRNQIDLETALALLCAHADLSLSDIYTFSIQDISSALNIAPNTIENLANELSLSFGDLSERDAELFFLDNPVWTRPLVALASGDIFCPMPQVFFGFSFQILGNIAKRFPSLERAYLKRRASFLESSVADLFQSIFPTSEAVRSFKWRDGADLYENDLAVKIDSHLILVECKSGQIQWPALRGAPRAAKNRIRALLIEPSLQSERIAKRIEAAISSNSPPLDTLPGFPLNLEQVRTVLRLSVTLEDLAMIQSAIHGVAKTGWVHSDHKLSPCITLPDLRVVASVLTSPSQALHYLLRRAELESNLRYDGGEIDLLGLYLDTGFNLGKTEFDGTMMNLFDMSARVDAYYQQKSVDPATKPPRLALSKWWRAILSSIEERRFPGWTDAATILLSVSPSDQRKAEKAFEKIKAGVKRLYRMPYHQSALVIHPPAPKSEAVVLFAFREQHYSERHTRISNVASEAFQNQSLRRCLVVGICIDREQAPYTFLSVLYNDDHPTVKATGHLVIH